MKRSKERRHDEVVMEIKEEIGTQKTICREMEEEMKSVEEAIDSRCHSSAMNIVVFLHLFKEKCKLKDWEQLSKQYYILNVMFREGRSRIIQWKMYFYVI